MNIMRQIKTTSADHEDEFAHHLLTETDTDFKGTFLDVGCGNGRHHNNTFTLEEAGWKGTLIDSRQELMEENTRIRKSRLCVANLVSVNWHDVMQKKPEDVVVIDYISFNMDDNILECVKNFPWSNIRFRVLTLKHNEFTNGPLVKEATRRILAEAGYLLLVGDVCNDYMYKPFADWYVDPKTISPSVFMKYANYGVRGIEVIYKQKKPLPQKFLSRSADLQDEFAARLIGNKGRFLDIGCNHGIIGNNTYTLEQLGWDGVMIDYDIHSYRWNKENRKANVFCDDVTNCDWNSILGKKPDEKIVFDFISFDVDDATVPALNHFPWSTVRFRVMTIEHDLYRVGPATRNAIREKMSQHGYILVAGDVCADFLYLPYEDWFIDPTTISPMDFIPYVSNGLRAAEVIYTPRT